MEIVLLLLAIILFTGLIFGKIIRKFKLPNVTGYLIGGVVFMLIYKLIVKQTGCVDYFQKYKEGFELIPTVALGFIAFSIGTEFKFSYFKQVGVRPVIIAIFESLGATVVVLIALLILHFINPNLISIPAALMLSAIASATAPAATIMVIKQYKAKGEVTSILLSVVALDDAVALMLFGIMFAIANTITSGAGSSVVWSIAKPLVEVIASLGIGFVFGIIITLLLRWFTGRGNRLCVIIVFVLLMSALETIISKTINISISTLLACMMAGAVFCNTNTEEKVSLVMELIDRFTPPFLIMFFVISGADLEFSSLSTVGIAGIVYVITRIIGKIAGSSFGAAITHSSKNVCKYLGLALVPQAGVAIGLSLVAVKALGVGSTDGTTIRTIVLCGTLIYELIGPFLSKLALKKSGEIQTNE